MPISRLRNCSRIDGGNRPIAAALGSEAIACDPQTFLNAAYQYVPQHCGPSRHFFVLSSFRICSSVQTFKVIINSDAAAHQAQAKGCVSYSVLPFPSQARSLLPSPIDWSFAPHLLEAQWPTIVVSAVSAYPVLVRLPPSSHSLPALLCSP
jgi:hypothetical protein